MIKELITNSFLLLAFCIFFGQLLGKLRYKNIKFGSSGGLFVGIIISYLLKQYILPVVNSDIVLSKSIIPNNLFKLSLIGFIASVGLLASKNIRETIRNNGFKFLILGFVITFTGAVSTWFFSNILLKQYNFSIIGSYVGALTSSPGLASALECIKNLGVGDEANVGLGYSIAYLPGVIIVIAFVQLLGRYHNISNINQNPNSLQDITAKHDSTEHGELFNIMTFSFVCLVGIIIGKIDIYLGQYIGYFSLGATGGVLISGLVLGNIKRVGPLNFNMDKNSLSVIRDISLNIFLSTVGLNYGYEAIHLIRTSGFQLLCIGTFTASISIITGYIVGQIILKMPPIHLIGGICGGMTSTPGLAAALESTNSDEVVTSYGATYPFALFFMILFTNILFKL